MEEEKKKLTDRQITGLALRVAKSIQKKAPSKDDALKVLEISKALLSMRFQD